MSDIYEQHEAAFRRVSAYVVLDQSGELVARVAIHFPRDGAGRLYAYFHLMGVRMVRAHAAGYGYDKSTAAVERAILSIPSYDGPAIDPADSDYGRALLAHRDVMRRVAVAMNGEDWTRALEAVGYRVVQAV
jgi:hypothetical protein